MTSRAGPGGGFGRFLWDDLVDALHTAMDVLSTWTSQLFRWFFQPISEVIQNNSSAGGPAVPDNPLLEFIVDVIELVENLFGLNILDATFFELTLGAFLPFLLVFTIYRYLKQ